jgi:hypothetical protein
MKHLYDVLAILAAVCTPIAPAVFYGWSAYSATHAVTGVGWLSIVAGVALALALELVGYLAGHAAVAFFERHDGRWMLAAGILLLYVVVGAWELTGVQRTAFFIAPLVYLLLALYRSLHEEDAVASEQAADERAWQRRQQEAADERQHALDLAQIQSQQAVAIERARIRSERAQSQQQPAALPAPLAPARYECEDCGQSFGSQPALNAHRRHCKGVPAANGHLRTYP